MYKEACKVLKRAGFWDDFKNYADQNDWVRPTLYGLGGAAAGGGIGAGVGALMGPENRGAKIGISAGAGAGIGALLGLSGGLYHNRKINRGQKPLATAINEIATVQGTSDTLQNSRVVKIKKYVIPPFTVKAQQKIDAQRPEQTTPLAFDSPIRVAIRNKRKQWRQASVSQERAALAEQIKNRRQELKLNDQKAKTSRIKSREQQLKELKTRFDELSRAAVTPQIQELKYKIKDLNKQRKVAVKAKDYARLYKIYDQQAALRRQIKIKSRSAQFQRVKNRLADLQQQQFGLSADDTFKWKLRRQNEKLISTDQAQGLQDIRQLASQLQNIRPSDRLKYKIQRAIVTAAKKKYKGGQVVSAPTRYRSSYTIINNDPKAKETFQLLNTRLSNYREALQKAAENAPGLLNIPKKVQDMPQILGDTPQDILWRQNQYLPIQEEIKRLRTELARTQNKGKQGLLKIKPETYLNLIYGDY